MVTYIGFDGNYDEVQWARLHDFVGRAGNSFAVFNGLDVTVSGSRQLSVTGGTALFPGVLAESIAAATLTPVSGSGVHTDTVVARADWAGTGGTVTVALKPGASTTPAALVQTAGVTWEMPLAFVNVPTGTGAMTVTPCKPLAGRGRPPLRGSDIVAGQVLASSSGKSVSTLDITDPGRPYYLQINARLRVSGDSGYAQIQVSTPTTLLASGYSAALTTNSGTLPILAVDTTGVMTGPVSLDMSVVPQGSSSPISWGGGNANAFLSVTQTYV